jgi:hypothetical protein
MSCDEADYIVLFCPILPTKCMSFLPLAHYLRPGLAADFRVEAWRDLYSHRSASQTSAQTIRVRVSDKTGFTVFFARCWRDRLERRSRAEAYSWEIPPSSQDEPDARQLQHRRPDRACTGQCDYVKF